MKHLIDIKVTTTEAARAKIDSPDFICSRRKGLINGLEESYQTIRSFLHEMIDNASHFSAVAISGIVDLDDQGNLRSSLTTALGGEIQETAFERSARETEEKRLATEAAIPAEVDAEPPKEDSGSGT